MLLRGLCFVLVAIVLSSCNSVVTTQPMPPGKRTKKTIPKEFRGLWRGETHPERLCALPDSEAMFLTTTDSLVPVILNVSNHQLDAHLFSFEFQLNDEAMDSIAAVDSTLAETIMAQNLSVLTSSQILALMVNELNDTDVPIGLQKLESSSSLWRIHKYRDGLMLNVTDIDDSTKWQSEFIRREGDFLVWYNYDPNLSPNIALEMFDELSSNYSRIDSTEDVFGNENYSFVFDIQSAEEFENTLAKALVPTFLFRELP